MKTSKWPLQKLCAINIFLLAFTWLSTGCLAQSRSGKTLLALSKANHTLAIVDPVSFNVLARIPVGSDPHEVIASEDGKTAYVSIYGGGSLRELNIIDPGLVFAASPLLCLMTNNCSVGRELRN